MLDIGWGDFFVLIVAALFILGPERLPGAATSLGRAIRKAREYASGAQEQLKSELGTDFDDLRKPLQELRGPIQQLRGLDPKRAINTYLFDAATPAPEPAAPVPATDTGHRPLGADEDAPYDLDAT